MPRRYHADAMLLFRFRTYFPDAYKKHYPNAKTHLSNKIRSTFPDGTSLFEKTRSKRRRPFTEAEDAALRAGYEKHGTTWATIVKDPIFQEQNRRSTDLRDRFRNAFPHLYQAAGYKPRSSIKKRVEGPMRAADDNLSQMSTAGPVRSRRQTQSRTGYLRGGTKSVPQSTVCSEDEDSSAGEEDDDDSRFKRPATPVLKDHSSTTPPLSSVRASPNSKVSTPACGPSPPASAPAAVSTPGSSGDPYMETNDDMDLVTIETEPLNIPDFMPNDAHSDIEAWSSGVNTPTHSSTAAWSIAGASPTSSHLSDFLMNATSSTSNDPSNASSPFLQRRHVGLGNNMIGKSAWGHDWFSSNPRLDASSAGSGPSFIDNSFSPASPFSFHPHLNHGVLDRYDLFPPSIPNDICSDAGLGDSHTTFSDDHGPGTGGVGGASAGGTGFKGYHSEIAGDLISGAGSRMQSFSSLPLSSLYEPFGSSFASGGSGILGLGLEGIPEDAGIHPMQLDASTSTFSGIDELGLTGISLNDNLESARGRPSTNRQAEDAMDDGTSDDALSVNFGLRSPDKNRQQPPSQHGTEKIEPESSILGDSFNLEDLVDMSNDLQHETPPATPIMAHSRSLRRSSQGAILQNFDGHAISSSHHRSISVPPSEARNAGGGDSNVGVSMDDVGVGLHMHSHLHGQHTHPTSPTQIPMGKGLQSMFGRHSPASGSTASSRSQRLGRSLEPMALTNSGGGSSTAGQLSPVPQQSTQTTSLFASPLMLQATSTSSSITSPNNTHAENSSHHLPHAQDNDPWRASATQTWMNPNSITSSDFYNVPYLDLHYSHGNVGLGLGNLATGLHDPSEARQGQEALDLAQSVALASSGLGLTSLGLNLAFGTGKTHGTPSSSPTGTIRMHHHLTAGINVLGKQPQPPSDTFGSVAAAIAAANAVGQGSHEPSNAGLNALDLTGTGTIRQSHFKSNSSAGRSMSHHRGQSAVCPQDLELRIDDNKRKRSSWDGGLA